MIAINVGIAAVRPAASGRLRILRAGSRFARRNAAPAGTARLLNDAYVAAPADDRPVLVAPDSFKGTFSAKQVAEAIGRGLASVGLAADLCPIADGGEGTLDASWSRVIGGGSSSAIRSADRSQPSTVSAARPPSLKPLPQAGLRLSRQQSAIPWRRGQPAPVS